MGLMQNHSSQEEDLLAAAAMMSNHSLPAVILNIGETFVPGLGLANRIASSYFQIDLTYHIVVAFGALAIFTGVSYVLSMAWDWLSPYIVATAEIRYDDEIWNFVMFWITKQKFSSKTTSFVAGVRTSSAYVWTGEDNDDNMEPENEEPEEAENAIKNWDKMKAINFTPASGRHIFWYNGRPFSLARYRSERQTLWSVSDSETIYISTLGRNTEPIKKLLHEAQMLYHERDGGKTVIYRGGRQAGASAEDLEWIRCLSRPPRPMSTVVLDQVQKDTIVNDMKEYLRSYTRKWYSNRGLPYRRGYLFHGPPGTGKTSLCFALAGLLNLRIYVVSLNSKSVTEDSLAKLFSNLPWRCIILLEDIDSAGITAKRIEVKEEEEESKEKTEAKEDVKAPSVDTGGANSTNPRGITLSAFLNIIDGVASSEGRILVMTTNHIEKLDPAILRPGRVDVTIRFQFANHEMTKGIFQAIYRNAEGEAEKVNDKDAKENHHKNHEANGHTHKSISKGEKDELFTPLLPPARSKYRQHNKSEEEIETLATKFADQMPLSEFTPAEIQGFLLRHKHDPQAAVDGVVKFVETLRAEKEVQKKGIA
ncbi:MAG: hypothetical protein GOMPHAMPRED_006462 [Gomphillus americanus]|uniref:P-loop containing nucleoside triphosphate hydrolase protein n=1 Tax=Gomphillus americanus TaxID=1940652 RepID=A0A8H3FWF1_9LECA|nr:MAG: hypothetical protein GOMPHAMPRED_006462 [Gomphillus americanus]